MSTKPAVVVKPASSVKPTPASVRRARRAVARTLTPAQKAAAAKMLPPSRQSLGAKVTAAKNKVLEISKIPATDAGAELQKKKLLNAATKELAGAVGAVKAQRARRARGQAGTVRLSSEQVKMQKAVVHQELDLVKQQLKDTKPVTKKPTSARQPLNTKVEALVAREEVLKNRLQLLDQGKDLDLPLKVDPSTVPEQRKPLQLPPASVPPAPIETVTVMNLLAQAMPRSQGESVAAYQARLREMTKRVLVRLARLGLLTGKNRGDAIRVAIEETLREDAAVISKEIKATGGVAKDAAADMMDPYVDRQAADLEAAATDVKPPVPAGDPTPADIAKLVAEAEQEEIIAATAPKELSDEIAEDLLLADVPVPMGTSDLFTTRNLVIGGGILLGVAYLLRGRT